MVIFNLFSVKTPDSNIRLFSDGRKWLKVSLSLIILVLMGTYYRHHIGNVVQSREYLRNLFKKGEDFNLCRSGVTIRHLDGIFYFVHQVDDIHLIIELKKLPNFGKNNLEKIYEIKGKIVYETTIDIKEINTGSSNIIRGISQNGEGLEDASIRTKYPKIYKLASLVFLKSKRKGKILRFGIRMEVQDTRATNPWIYKIVVSGLTALIIFCLFFTFCQFTRKGFVCRGER